jgi:hypothetical protein
MGENIPENGTENKIGDQPESAAHLFRWYGHHHLNSIAHPSNGIDIILKAFKNLNVGNIISNIKQIFMPKKINFEGSPSQAGGGMLTHTDYKIKVYYDFRMNAYYMLLLYLNKNNINIDLITKKLLKKMYLYYYDLDYVKFLNYVLSKIRKEPISNETKYELINMFSQMRNHIYNSLME